MRAPQHAHLVTKGNASVKANKQGRKGAAAQGYNGKGVYDADFPAAPVDDQTYATYQGLVRTCSINNRLATCLGHSFVWLTLTESA